MVYKFGIIGLPNVGKSALFNKITKLNVPSKNFPFCTINPNIGIISVPDDRLEKIAHCVSSTTIVHSLVKLIDIAGLVKGASTGEGLGNQFLEKIRECHAIIHVTRFFKSNNITHIYEKVDPIRDVEIINSELLLSDFSVCNKIIKKLLVNKAPHQKNKDLTINLIQLCISHLQRGIFLKDIAFTEEELEILKQFRFLTFKPMIYVLNLECNLDCNFDISKFIQSAQLDPSIIFPIFVESLDSNNCNTVNKKTRVNNIDIIKYTDCNEIIKKLCNFLNLKTFFTAGKKEVRAWMFKSGSTVLQGARFLHTDFFRGFIRAQVVSYHDFIRMKSIRSIKECGKMRSEGKKYIIQDGDIIHFLFNI
ncbi:redox-regulated ATPase YchF [Buchnera aphidicola]|uniref:Ribosome-binding ATPase YchF n=1 Tax=Buchnera aphidicola (Cinara strobi) TaxID=1921549 RepID=A0A3B1DL29_9GAMM|nr:redox-regulated ATPase YchF [Buchnera aphidicola]VAX76421.1 Ribosome-binding ATPase YchF [Buchnera aphidicola (Cinara strobi)]